jgi:hypothetical protein
MMRKAALVMACWTAVSAANAQVVRLDWDNKNRAGGDSIREQLRSVAPQPPQPVARQMPGQNDYRGGGDRADWGSRRGGRMNGRPDSWNGSGVRDSARKIESDASKLLADYADKSRTGNFLKKISREMGLSALRTLDDAARRYEREVSSRWTDPLDTREAFRALVRALDAAEDALPMAYNGGQARAQLACVSDAVDDLVRYYRWEDRQDDRRDDRGRGRGGNGGRRDDDRGRGGWERARPLCGGVNFYGKFYEGGGCTMDGCWTAGGGCNFYGCWETGGGCNFYGCWRRGGSCEFHGCVGQVAKLPSQPCSD